LLTATITAIVDEVTLADNPVPEIRDQVFAEIALVFSVVIVVPSAFFKENVQ